MSDLARVDVLAPAERDRLVFAEIRVGRNKPTPEQLAWLEALREAGVEVHVWNETSW